MKTPFLFIFAGFLALSIFGCRAHVTSTHHIVDHHEHNCGCGHYGYEHIHFDGCSHRQIIHTPPTHVDVHIDHNRHDRHDRYDRHDRGRGRIDVHHTVGHTVHNCRCGCPNYADAHYGNCGHTVHVHNCRCGHREYADAHYGNCGHAVHVHNCRCGHAQYANQHYGNCGHRVR